MTTQPARNAVCPCGSQLKYKRCCGRNPPQQTNYQEGLQTGWRLQQQGYFDQALSIYLDLLVANPKDAKLLYLTGAVYHSQDKLEPAWQYIDAGIKNGMSDPAAFFQYSELLSHRGEYDKAVTFLLKALKKRPEFFQAEKLLANIYFELSQYGDAEAHYSQALVLNEADDAAHHNLAKTLAKRNRDADAILHYEKAHELNPDNVETQLALANILEQNNILDKAEVISRRVLENDPGQFNMLLTSSKIAFRKKLFDKSLAFLDRMPVDSLPEANQIEVLNQRALILDKIQDFSSAFTAQKESKRRARALREEVFDKNSLMSELQAVEQQASLIGDSWPLDKSYAKPISLQPIFVVGFFRSGTTLVHQILSSHRDVIGAGELNFVQRLEQQLKTELGDDYLSALRLMPAPQKEKVISKARSSYSKMVNSVAQNYSEKKARFIVDKYPFNILRLPFIRLIFPEAVIIQMVRNPFDTVISCFFTNFQDEYSWADDMEECAEVYAIVHAHSTRMLREIEPGLRTLKYEDLINNFDGEVGNILDFAGLPWDESCLSFHQNKSIPRTPSYAQVTEKIYSSSTRRANDYKDFIPSSVFSLLNKITLELGY